MASNPPSKVDVNTKDLMIALTIFIIIIILAILLAWRFNPPTQIFSEDFENAVSNQQYLTCGVSTIVNGRLRVTITESQTGYAVMLPNEYDDFTFLVSVYPVQDTYDGSINLLFRQNDYRTFEAQFRPNQHEYNFIETMKNVNHEIVGANTTGWRQDPELKFNKLENIIKLTVTKNVVDVWFNEDLVFSIFSRDELYPKSGKISIGAGAGEVGGIAYEFDNIKIYSERLYSRWIHDFLAAKEYKRLKQ